MNIAHFKYIEPITLEDWVLKIIDSCGANSKDVSIGLGIPDVKKQLDSINEDDLRKELDLHGYWSDEELKNHKDNLHRILWIATWDMHEVK